MHASHLQPVGSLAAWLGTEPVARAVDTKPRVRLLEVALVAVCVTGIAIAVTALRFALWAPDWRTF